MSAQNIPMFTSADMENLSSDVLELSKKYSKKIPAIFIAAAFRAEMSFLEAGSLNCLLENRNKFVLYDEVKDSYYKTQQSGENDDTLRTI